MRAWPRAHRALWLLPAVAAAPARAHSPVPGFEGFYVGAIHPFSTPAQALMILGLALLIGGFTPAKARWPLADFLIASFAGLLTGPSGAEPDTPLFAGAFAACALAALAPGMGLFVAIGLAGLGGYLIGDLSVPDPGPARDRLITMAGSMVGANLGLLYLFGLSTILKERFPWPWVPIAFRVAAAWLGAAALLMLALGYAETLSE